MLRHVRKILQSWHPQLQHPQHPEHPEQRNGQCQPLQQQKGQQLFVLIAQFAQSVPGTQLIISRLAPPRPLALHTKTHVGGASTHFHWHTCLVEC